MGGWLRASKVFQVFYLITVMISILITAISSLAKNFEFNNDELYEKYIEHFNRQQEEEGLLDEGNEIPYEYTKFEITMANYFVKFLVTMVLPASVLVYRSRILGLNTFVSLKKHQGAKHKVHLEGVAYNPCLQWCGYLFCCSNLRKMNYIEYITYKSKHLDSRQILSDKAAFYIFFSWLIIQSYYHDINDFFLAPLYMWLLVMLLF